MADTIAAIATPPGKGGVGIVRVSGPQASTVAKKMVGKVLAPRVATFSRFLSADSQLIDQGVAIYFKAPQSFTGEDVVELQGHGGPVVMDLLLQAVLQQGVRLANPGEFSQRAFLNGKIDLAQAEAVADLIDASSQQAALSAVRSLQGEFSRQITVLLERLIHLRMMVEAAIDFPEEEIDFLAESHVAEDLAHLLSQLTAIRQSAQQGVLLQEGLQVVITGKPNVGKSSLLNALSGRDSAIVTNVPGTTRDTLREFIQLDGLPLHIIDTAGIRTTTNVVEQEGVRRAQSAIDQADVVLLMEDATNPQTRPAFPGKTLVVLQNKIDLLQEPASVDSKDAAVVLRLSVKTGEGLAMLSECLKEIAGFKLEEGQFIARRRHLDALQRCETAIAAGLHQLQQSAAGELLAEELRGAQKALSEITGEFTTEDLLGQIFSSFCIGK
jgi:tRNA modification GTPase